MHVNIFLWIYSIVILVNKIADYLRRFTVFNVKLRSICHSKFIYKRLISFIHFLIIHIKIKVIWLLHLNLFCLFNHYPTFIHKNSFSVWLLRRFVCCCNYFLYSALCYLIILFGEISSLIGKINHLTSWLDIWCYCTDNHLGWLHLIGIVEINLAFFLCSLGSFTWMNGRTYLIRIFLHNSKINIRLKIIWLKIKLLLLRSKSFFKISVSITVNIIIKLVHLSIKWPNYIFMDLLLWLEFIIMLKKGLLIKEKLRRQNILLVILKNSFSFCDRYILNWLLMKCRVPFEYDMAFEFLCFRTVRFLLLYGDVF